MKTEDFKKGDIVFSTEKQSGKVYRGAVVSCGKKTFTIKHDDYIMGSMIHYHRNMKSNYYMSFKNETV